MDPARRLEQGLSDYRSGKVRSAVLHFEDVVTSPRASREQELEGLFWLASSLHGLCEFERAIGMIEAVCFDDGLVRGHRDILYRLATRLALLLIDAGTRCHTDVLRVVERAEAIAAGFESTRRSRALLTRGYLFEAMGRDARALRLYERSYEARCAEPSPFADTRYLRSLVPALMRAGRFEDARKLLDEWRESNDPFATPHVQICWAAYHHAQGDPDQGLRWAQSAVTRAAEIEDVPGDILAWCVLVRNATLAGRPEATRNALRAAAALRRRAGVDQRLAIDLATVDANVGLACLHGGLPVYDPVSGRHHPRAPEAAHDPAAALRSLRRARSALRRAERVAAAGDEVFSAKVRGQEVRRRERILAEHEHALRQPRLPLAAEPSPATELARAADRDRLPVELGCDADGSYLVAPTQGLRGLLGYVSRHRRHLVLHPAERHIPMSLDLWRRNELMASAQLCFDEDRLGRRVVVRADALTPPAWLERLGVEVAHHVARDHLRRGNARLERGRIENAAEHFATALALDATSGIAAERLAHCLLRTGRVAEATGLAARALEIDSTVSPPWRTLGESFEAGGRTSDARHAYEQALGRLQDGDAAEHELLEARVDALGHGVA